MSIKVKINKVTAKGKYHYPVIRLPFEYEWCIGENADSKIQPMV